MIAKLSTSTTITSSSSSGGGGCVSTSTASNLSQLGLRLAPTGSAQSKRKRAKLLDILLNSNWSKHSQQASYMTKLNKILLACDPNFLDEKSGESPLSLAISSAQINSNFNNNGTHSLANQSIVGTSSSSSLLSGTNSTQSNSLFSLQSANYLKTAPTTTNGQLILQQTNISELSQSKAPLIERLVILLVKFGARIDFRNSDGKTPLHVAAMKSNFWALKTLLELGAPTDYRDINGLTPLYYSILHKADLKATQLLLAHNKNPSIGSAATSCCSTTISNGSNDNNVAQQQQQQQLKSIGVADQHGWQEVHQACKLGLEAHLEKLLYYGCDMNAKIDGSGNTPLHVAAINDQLNCAQVLLMRGADKNITNNSHQTAHQVAVISNNMDLAEFIAEHTEANVVPFRDRPPNFPNYEQQQHQNNQHHHHQNHHNPPAPILQTGSIRSLQQQLPHHHQRYSFCSSNRSSLASSRSFISDHLKQQQHRASVVPIPQQQPVKPNHHMDPLSLDVANPVPSASSTGAPCSNSSQSQSLLSIGNGNQIDPTATNQQLNIQVSDISPCLSQRSCATSNTTSSSGVCCDGDGNNSAEELQQQQRLLSNSLSQHSNVTVIAIGSNNSRQDEVDSNSSAANNQACNELPSNGLVEQDEEDDQRSSSGSSGSSNGLYSLMSEERPLFAGTFVEATSEYQSGDPSHLQLRRGDLIEVLECASELLQSGQLPRLANKPMLFGRRQSDGALGLFPSFCVHRARHQRRRHTTLVSTNGINNHQRSILREMGSILNGEETNIEKPQRFLTGFGIQQNIRGTTIPESHSMAALQDEHSNSSQSSTFSVGSRNQQLDHRENESPSSYKLSFKQLEVTLSKGNEGFGFVLRGAKVEASALSTGGGSLNNSANGAAGKLIVDERLMAANNLISLQYLDEIEPNSAAHRAGLKRGDFLVAVNGLDVRLSSHEQVVNMVRQSGNQVHLAIASPMSQQQQQQHASAIYSSKTLAKVKPEPPKRDPTTTLTRNKAQRVRSMLVHPNQHLQLSSNFNFDADKPLPVVPLTHSPMSPTGSLNTMTRSISTNITQFHSAQSLASNNGLVINGNAAVSSQQPDTHSISSMSTVSAEQQFGSQHHTPTQSSSSTTTLTTVASGKPQAPPKSAALQLQSNNQQIYQPAVITTTTRKVSQPNLSPSSVASIADSIASSSPKTGYNINTATTAQNVASQVNKAAVVANVQPQPPPPPPPPLPPPLPNFSLSPQSSVTNSKRRTSAPVMNVVLDGSKLQRKRDSLANVPATTSSHHSGQPPVPAQFGAVAAACAAAANNRLQRQQQQQLHLEAADDASQSSLPVLEEHQQVAIESPRADKQDAIPPTSPPKPPSPPPASNDDHPTVGDVPRTEHLEPLEAQPQKLVNTAHACSSMRQQQVLNQQHMSATLGRKSSAQIIQQPKHHAPLSQTLKASRSKSRPSIPSYEKQPSPPPPLPEEPARILVGPKHQSDIYQFNYQQTGDNQDAVSWQRDIQPAGLDNKRYIQEYHNQQPILAHQHHHHQQQQQQHHQRQQMIIKEQFLQQQLLQQQQQPLTTQQQQQQQQQLIKQQRQQQLMQQHQQLLLQQQMQLEQRRLCQGGKHVLPHHHNHQEQQPHIQQQQQQQQPLQQQYSSSVPRNYEGAVRAHHLIHQQQQQQQDFQPSIQVAAGAMHNKQIMHSQQQQQHHQRHHHHHHHHHHGTNNNSHTMAHQARQTPHHHQHQYDQLTTVTMHKQHQHQPQYHQHHHCA